MGCGQICVVRAPGPELERRVQHGLYQGPVIGKNKTISCLNPMSYIPQKSVTIVITPKGF